MELDEFSEQFYSNLLQRLPKLAKYASQNEDGSVKEDGVVFCS